MLCTKCEGNCVHEIPTQRYRTLVYTVECPIMIPIQNCRTLALMYGRFFGGFCPHSDPTYSFRPSLSALLTRHRQAQGTSAQRIGHEFCTHKTELNQKNSCNQLKAGLFSSKSIAAATHPAYSRILVPSIAKCRTQRRPGNY